MILTSVVIWGIAGPVIKFTLEGIDPLPFMVYRLGISSIISLIFFGSKIAHGKKFHQLRAHIPLAIIYGFLAVPVGLGMLFLGLDQSTVLDLSLVGFLGPLLSLAGGAYFFHDHITKRQKFGIAVVIAGVILNSFYPLFMEGSEIRLTGNVLLIAYLFADSASVLLAKRSLRFKIKSANLTNLAFIIGFVTLFPIVIYTHGFTNFIEIILALPLKYHIGVWYMALLSGSLAYYLYIRAERTLDVSETVLFNYLHPVVTIPLAIFWLHESLSSHFIIGAIIIAVGLFIVEYKKQKPKAVADK